ncbi:MAG: nuclear transport factor 2 family protein [Acidimicrobiia bacterium]
MSTLDVADRLDIGELYARYCLTFDGGDLDAWTALFAPDGTFQIAGGVRLSGTDELADFAKQMYAGAPGIRHLVSNVSISAADGGARGSAYVVALGTTDDGAYRILTLGQYDDAFAKGPAGWRFHARTFTPWAAMDNPGIPLIGGA